MSLPNVDEIREEIADLDSGQERLSYLIELGGLLPDFPKEWCTEEYRVVGCQSMVWVVADMKDGVLHISASSDAPMVAGLIVILFACYQRKSPQEIVDFPIEQFLSEIKLKDFLTPMRSNGLYAMVQRIREIALRELGSPVDVKGDKQEPTKRTDYRSLNGVRSDFPILDSVNSSGKPLIYFDNAASAQRPEVVLDRMNEVYHRFYSNAHRSGHRLAYEVTGAMEEARQTVARFLGSSNEKEVVFTSGATASINMIARGMDSLVTAGDEIILSEMEHHSNIVPWQQLAERTGASIRWIPITPKMELDLSAYRSLLNARTKIIAITAVSNVLGTINPVKEIAAEAHRFGANVVIDAAQAVPHGALEVVDWDADFVAFSGHKMLGPTGIGVLWGKEARLLSLPPMLGGGGMIHRVTKAGFTLADLPSRFEAGTPPSVEAIGLKVAIDYLQSFDPEAIAAHERLLVGRAESLISSIPGLRVFGGPLEKRAGILTFVVDGIHSDMIGRFLDEEGIAVRVGHHCAMPLHDTLGIASSCRASFYLYNTEEEVDIFASALRNTIERLRA